jgi:molecular chaperone GrpE
MTSNDPTTGRTSTSSEEAEEGEVPGEVEQDEKAGADEAGATGSFETEAAEIQADFDALNDRHLRLAAEFDNFRRRAQNEMRESWERAQADLVRRLVDSLDDLQRVADIDPKTTTVPALIEGLELVERKLFRALEDAGVEAIDPAGAAFDPESMEAVMRVPADSEDDDDHVDQVFQKGYRLKGQLVRPARVSVRKHE